jgi:hypothetical protein
MSDIEEYDSFYDDENSDSLSIEFSDDGDEHFVDDLRQEDTDMKIMYSFPTPTTASGIPTHRMKYLSSSVDDIQVDLKSQIQRISTILHLDYGKCLLLLLFYDWNEDKLVDEYANSRNQIVFLQERGICNDLLPNGITSSIVSTTDPNMFCGICYCEPNKKNPMDFFSLNGCKHSFCTDCYIHYIKNKNEESQLFIDCPFFNPKCNLKLTITELKVLSDYSQNQETPKMTKIAPDFGTQLISEEEVKNMYNLSTDEDSKYDSDGNSINQSDEDSGKSVLKLNEMIYDFQAQLREKERQEHEAKYNKTIVSKYWHNVCTQYCATHPKKYKHCPYPDCDNVVQFLGFESDVVANVEEQADLFLIPLVKCTDQHQFCFGCNEVTHSPCPCEIVEKWKKKCNDDSETLNWIQANTKDCPKCKVTIEKNGGCNHMTCRKCHYEFCWPCLGDWKKHLSNYRCDKFVERSDIDSDSKRASLERYIFYFTQFNNQRISHDKDRELLSQFETKIKQLQVTSGVSWIETTFYKECINALLECRQCLKWSYVFLFYIPSCHGKQLIEIGQWQLSNKVEQLSELFGNVAITNILSKKSLFIKTKTLMVTAQEKFLEICIDTFADQDSLKKFKERVRRLR